MTSRREDSPVWTKPAEEVGEGDPRPGAGPTTAPGPEPELLQLAMRRAAIAILWITPEGRCQFANEAACRMLGYSREELLSSTISDLDLDFPPKRWPGFWKSLRESPSLEFTSIYRSKEGRIFPVEIVASHFEHDGREYAVATARDISERRDAERALRESQERLKVLFEYAPDGYFLSDLGGKFVDLNRAAEEITGYTKAELVGRSFLSVGLLSPRQTPAAARGLSLNALGRPTGPGELVLTRKDGEKVWVEVRTYPLQIQGEFLILGIGRDITARKQAEKELRLTQFTVNQAPDSVFWLSMDGKILQVNQGAQDSLGYERGRLVGKAIWELDPEGRPEPWLRICETIRSSGSETFTSEQLCADGTRTPVEIAVSHLEFEGEEFAVAFTRDIRERLLVDEAVQRSEAEFRAIFEHAPYGILRTTLDGEVLMANPAMAEMLGYGSPRDLRGVDMGGQVWVSSQDRDRLMAEVCHRGRIEKKQVKWRRRNLEEITVRLSSRVGRNEAGEPEFLEDVVEDISDQIRLEDQLRQAQKMEAVGQLTGGIAHDFNNLTSVILLNARLIRDALEEGMPVPLEDLQEVEDAAQKAATMTSRLLGFSRRASLTRVPTDLSRVLSNLSPLLRRLLPEDIELDVDIHEGPERVEADVSSVEQMVLNLVTNARDAMPGGGRLRLEVRERELDEGVRRERPWLRPGRYVCIRVADTGRGMDPEILDRVFDPFFTTKPVGEGTGLGMAMVYGLTKQHGGFVIVDSAPGRGTRVDLLFPVIASPPTPSSSPPEETPTEGPKTGSETILLVEDEAALRRSGKRVLERFGYRVLLAENGAEGLEVFRKDGPIDLVISDMVMPKLGGAELYRALRDAGEDVPFLMVSGYTGDEGTERKVLDPSVPILSKPWDIGELLDRVRQLLD